MPCMIGPTVCSTYRQGRLYAFVILARPVGSSPAAAHDAHSSRSCAPAGGTDRVVNARGRHEAAQHGAVGRVDDRVCGKRGDIPLPEVPPQPDRRQVEPSPLFPRARPAGIRPAPAKMLVGRHGERTRSSARTADAAAPGRCPERDTIPVSALPADRRAGNPAARPVSYRTPPFHCPRRADFLNSFRSAGGSPAG